MALPTSRAARRRTARRSARRKSRPHACSSAGPIRPSTFRSQSSPAWREAGSRGKAAHGEWEARLEQPAASGTAVEIKEIAGRRPALRREEKLAAFKADMIAQKPEARDPQIVRDGAAGHQRRDHMTIGGSADLTHSNFTITKGMKSVKPDDFSGRYIHYGIREHAMGAAMNGIALHGGFVPYGGTFLVFSDYCSGSIRLSALMGLARALRADPRLHRRRRGRPHAPAHRASGDAARHAEPLRVPARRRGRDG